MLNYDEIKRLLDCYSDDEEMIDIICDALGDFEEYHSAIYDMENKLMALSYKTMETAERQSVITSLDSRRTTLHNKVITSVNVLNRIAKAAGMPPLYDGVVSEEKPYRRLVANAVLEYVEGVVKNRR